MGSLKSINQISIIKIVDVLILKCVTLTIGVDKPSFSCAAAVGAGSPRGGVLARASGVLSHRLNKFVES